MVAIKNTVKIEDVPQYGGNLELIFESRDDVEKQLKEHLIHASLFVHSETMPKAFSEFQTTLYFSDHSSVGKFQSRLVQTLEMGPQRGFLLQIMDHLEEIKASAIQVLESPQKEKPDTPEADSQKRNRLTIQQELRRMTPTQRGIYASKADKHTRSVMIRDHEPLVIMFLLKNPRITKQEVLEISKVKALNYQAIQMITGNRQWIQIEEVRYNLVMNPKTPVQIVMKLLRTLNMKHIREIAKNHNMKTQIKQAALRLVVGQSR